MPSDDVLGRGASVMLNVERICHTGVESAALDGGGVSLVTARGHRGTICATNDVAAKIEELQFTLGEGPCVDAAYAGQPVLIDDLQSRTAGLGHRWPGFTEAVGALGVRAIFAVPLRIGAIPLGVLDGYRRTPGELGDERLRGLLLAADSASMALLELIAGDGGLDDGARPSYRVQVHQAAGMMTVQLGVSIEEALVQLRSTAYVQERPIDQVAADIVTGRLRFPVEGS